MKNAIRYKNTNVPRQSNEVARLKVVQGPDEGAVYIVTGAKVTLGRGEDNDVTVVDLKTSRLHAEMSSNTKGWTIRDKASINGILHNGKSVKNAELKIN